MPGFDIRRGSRRHLVWLLSAALLLPVVQTAAMWHVLSPACAERAGEHDQPSSSHPTHCEFCLTVAGVLGGAPSHLPPAVGDSAGSHEVLRVAADLVVPAPSHWPYRTRAPPVAPR